MAWAVLVALAAAVLIRFGPIHRIPWSCPFVVGVVGEMAIAAFTLLLLIGADRLLHL